MILENVWYISRYVPTTFDTIDFIAAVTEYLNRRTLVSGACIKLHYLPKSDITKRCVVNVVKLDIGRYMAFDTIDISAYYF